MAESLHYTIILTGGIATGKSSVAIYFRELGVNVIDADKISHQIVEPGKEGWDAIQQGFDDNVFLENNRLDRKKLRTLIFTDPSKREKLESLLHPIIRKHIQQQLQASQSDYTVLDVPLYAENVHNYQAHRVLVVDIPEALQISRLMQRDKITENEAMEILKIQTSRAKRLELADDIIDNTGTMEQLAQRVASLHADYIRQSHGQNLN